MKSIYYHGDFITLENFEIEALLIEDGIIKKLGNLETVLSYRDADTKLIDLKGHTMMPSFIDAHSHFSGVANRFLKVNLEGCRSFQDIQNRLQQFKIEKQIPDDVWILAEGYDHNHLVEARHPKKEVIDAVLPHNPVILQHQSGHVGVCNTMALNHFHITLQTPSFEGGLIEKVDGKLTGYMEENAFLHYLGQTPLPESNLLLSAYQKAQELYLSYGITTVQDGMAYPSMISIYQNFIQNHVLSIDLVSYIAPQDREIFFSNFGGHIKQYRNHFKLGGYKIFLDGSPQGKTAWMRTPYVDDTNYFGYSTLSDTQVESAIQEAMQTNMQLLAHCNGDKAAEQLILHVKKHIPDIFSIRPVMIHAQLLGIDQMDEIKKCGILPSFFISHIFHWGDIHIKNFGYERASQISPAGSAAKKGILFTFHQDSPVLPPNMFETIWCAVTRQTKEGTILGEGERISVLEAIKAVTLYSAYQYFEEDKKGSIREGKIADLIIVDKNPLKVPVSQIPNITILETIKEGVSLFQNYP